MSLLSFSTSKDYNFSECLRFFRRSDQECLFEVGDNYVRQAIDINNKVFLIKFFFQKEKIKIKVEHGVPDKNEKTTIKQYVKEWLDADRDLTELYDFAKKEKILKHPVEKAKGLRLIGVPNLMEAISWAIIGQQINLKFAYSLKKRLVENFGTSLFFEDKKYFLFPKPEVLADLTEDDLRPLQFSRSKAKYLIGVANEISKGKINKTILQQLNYKDAKAKLVEIKGVGPWTADYVLMKCLRRTEAFPIADVGLHNAIKYQLGMDRKPTIEEIEKMTAHYPKEWLGYVTFYLWHSLL